MLMPIAGKKAKETTAKKPTARPAAQVGLAIPEGLPRVQLHPMRVHMKPHVVCLMASSVDGRTLHSRWRPDGRAGELFEQVHDELAGDAWLVGRVTGQEFAKGKPYPASRKKTFPRESWFARRDAKAYGVVLDAQGKIGWGPFGHRRRPDRGRLVRGSFGCAPGGIARRGRVLHLRRKSELDLALALDILNRELGVKRLPAGGRRRRNGAFLRAGLVDELI